MNNLHSFEIGDNHVVLYQRFVFLTGILLIAFLLVIGYSQKENYIFDIALVTTIGWLIIVYLYSNIYEVVLTDSGFEIKNFIRNNHIDPMKFKKIRRVKYFGFLMIIVFTDRKYYFLMKSKDFIKDFIFADKEFVSALNQRITAKIQVMKGVDNDKFS